MHDSEEKTYSCADFPPPTMTIDPDESVADDAGLTWDRMSVRRKLNSDECITGPLKPFSCAEDGERYWGIFGVLHPWARLSIPV